MPANSRWGLIRRLKIKTRVINDQIRDDLKSEHINQCNNVFLMV